MSKYIEELKRSMKMLSQNDKTIFIGQSIIYKGNAVFETLEDVSIDKRIEFPVAENLQMGVSLGLALNGDIPISIYPRFDFLVLALDQLVNHIDKWPLISQGKSLPKVIVRVVVGSDKPLDPGHQHKADYTEALKLMCKTIDVIKLDDYTKIYPAYELALNREDGKSTVLIEYGNLYNGI